MLGSCLCWKAAKTHRLPRFSQEPLKSAGFVLRSSAMAALVCTLFYVVMWELHVVVFHQWTTELPPAQVESFILVKHLLRESLLKMNQSFLHKDERFYTQSYYSGKKGDVLRLFSLDLSDQDRESWKTIALLQHMARHAPLLWYKLIARRIQLSTQLIQVACASALVCTTSHLPHWEVSIPEDAGSPAHQGVWGDPFSGKVWCS